jgi:uncharacterized protein DUF3187
LFSSLVAHAAGAAEPNQFEGLLRVRDLSPFGFLRLDMRPAHAVSLDRGGWSFEAELGYQNTWALSPQVEKYLTSIESQGRHKLGPDDVAAIRALPGENYLVDLEAATLDLAWHYKFASHFSAYAIVSAVTYQGGFLDGAIEGFHDTFGFSSFGRPALAKNDVNFIYHLKSTQFESLGTPTSGGILDPTLGLRYSGIQLGDKWSVSVESAVKVPLSGRRTLLSTGRLDTGLQVSATRKGTRSALYLDVAGVYFSGGTVPVPQDHQVIPTAIVGYEYAVTGKTSAILQGYVSTSVYSHRQTDLDELLATKFQLSLGVRHRWEGCTLSFAATENLQNVNNTPDIGFQLGLAYLHQPR